MADADEDLIFHPSSSSHDSAIQVENDLSDETQDFRFLNNLSLISDPSQASIPRRGEKDFEPNSTLLQSDALAVSRQAMHNALSFPRLHYPKNKIIGIYVPDGPAPPPTASGGSSAAGSITAAPGAKKPLASGIGVPADACVYVVNPKGQHFRTMGQADRWNRIWLLPEEALYLLERGSLEIWWSSAGPDGNGQDELDIPMSLQAAYTCLIGRAGLTLERFSVFSGLRRGGYVLVRAPSWDEREDDEVQRTSIEEKPSIKAGGEHSGLMEYFGRLLRLVYNANETASAVSGPLIGLGIHRRYDDIYRRLSLIPCEDPSVPDPPARPTSPPFRLAYHVYKPSTPFRKSAPPEPDFRIAVVNARTTTIPTLSQLRALLESTPLNPPRGEKLDRQLYMRLRHGYRNVILAIVDQGVVSFLRFGDAGFSKEKIFGDKAKPKGPKRGGFSGRGGRGRGKRK
jgi:tRNA-splicing endonuclease subunit Sen54